MILNETCETSLMLYNLFPEAVSNNVILSDENVIKALSPVRISKSRFPVPFILVVSHVKSTQLNEPAGSRRETVIPTECSDCLFVTVMSSGLIPTMTFLFSEWVSREGERICLKQRS